LACPRLYGVWSWELDLVPVGWELDMHKHVEEGWKEGKHTR
jgi:hypothetical protein